MIGVYCDGSSNGRAQSPGGYGWAIILNDGVVIASGHGAQQRTTNNRMELAAIFFGVLEAQTRYANLLRGQYVEVVSDSQYALGAAAGTTKAKANQDLVVPLQKLIHESPWPWHFRWVHGHRGERWNELADREANLGKAEAERELKQRA